MKNIIFLALMCLLTITSAIAQTKVYPGSVPSFTAAGDFNNGTDTGARPWTNSQVPLYTKLDTVTGAAGVGDSVRERVVGEINQAALGVYLTKYTGTNCDSVQVAFWGTVTPGNGSEPYALLQTGLYTVATTGYVEYRPAWDGNRFTNLRVSVILRDAVGSCGVSHREYYLIR